MAKTEFEQFIADEIEKGKGRYIPVKAGPMERLFVKKAACTMLHPNPDDEFCFPDVGPSYKIISDYVSQIQLNLRQNKPVFDSPVIVEKTRPDGYLLLNGHHRWAAAVKLGIKKIPVRIVNLALESDIEKMLENSKHDKRVTLDLDEVVFRTPDDPNVEPLPTFADKKKRIRLGIPALFRFLAGKGYDIWVYSAFCYSIEDVKKLFRKYAVNVDGIITGTAKKKKHTTEDSKKMEQLIANKYATTIHIDNDLLLHTVKGKGNFEEYPITVSADAWAKEIIRIMGELEDHEKDA